MEAHSEEELQTPTSVSNLLRYNPFWTFVYWFAFVVASYAVVHTKMHLGSVPAALLGLIIGTAAWALLMFLAAKRWVGNDAD